VKFPSPFLPLPGFESPLQAQPRTITVAGAGSLERCTLSITQGEMERQAEEKEKCQEPLKAIFSGVKGLLK